MTYQVRIEAPTIREEKIRAALQSSTEPRRDFYHFRNQKTRLKHVRIASDLLVYRMENCRTFVDQGAYRIREGKGVEFFVAGQENESVQQIQHEILTNLNRAGRKESVVPIVDVLKTEKQREDILITHRGVVVNGNRRLAAMRELFQEDKNLYAEFSDVDCMVLPADITPKEIVGIEARLQGQPDTKLEYDWIGDCILIQKSLEMGSTMPEYAKQQHKTQADIRKRLAAFAEATVYLKDWAKAEGEYTRVRDSEQFFNDLPSLLQGKNEGLANASRVIAWNLFENVDQLEDRLYAFNTVIGKNANDVMDQVAERLDISVNENTIEDDGSFDVDVDAPEMATVYQPVIDALRDPVRMAEALDVLIEVSRSVVEQERGRKSTGAALKAIIKANARLSEVDLSRADPSGYATMDRQLQQIGKRVSELRATLTRLQTPTSTPAPDGS